MERGAIYLGKMPCCAYNWAGGCLDEQVTDSSNASQATSAAAVGSFLCPHCAQSLTLGTLACPYCGGLVYEARLKELSNEALTLEQTTPLRAVAVWQQTLRFLPQNSPQYVAICERIGALAGGWGAPVPVIPAAGSGRGVELGYEPRQARVQNDSLPIAFAKTGGSMLVSFLVYYWFFDKSVSLALGLVLLILVHELGHVAAMWYYGLSVGPPIFIPFIGGQVRLRQLPPNAKVEAVVGISGPIAGTLGALICLFAYLLVPALHSREMYFTAVFGFLMNFINLIPMPPLDGGRVTAAISPWTWLVGVVALIALIAKDFRVSSYNTLILLFILFNGLPRLLATLKARGRDDPYYRTSRLASWSIGGVYVALAGGLFAVLWVTDAFKMFFG